MNETIYSQVKKLSYEEKILLVEEIWDDIALNEEEEIQLSRGQKDEINRRFKKYKKDTKDCLTWNEAKIIIKTGK
jgi:putative addiction module component (TIGR02574 family)